jgi:hypothetical protein
VLLACIAVAHGKPFDPDAVKANSKEWGYIPVMNTLAAKFDMPVMIINGAKPGRSLLFAGQISDGMTLGFGTVQMWKHPTSTNSRTLV